MESQVEQEGAKERIIQPIRYQLVGDDMQAIVVALNPGEQIQAEAGVMLYMSEPIRMLTSSGGGFFKGMKRMLTGESFFITTFECVGDQPGTVSFSAPYPGKIIPLNISELGPVLCQRGAYLCSACDVDISIAFTKKLGAGFFGGEGFILQKLQGDGLVFLHAGGAIISKSLKNGEKIRVDTGCVVAFQSTVNYSIEIAGGVKSSLFGGEGMFLTTLTGPGKIYLQTLPFPRFADRVFAAISNNKDAIKRS